MKIVATTKTGFLIEALESEVMNLCGYANKFELRENRRVEGKSPAQLDLAIGDVIQVSKMFDHLKLMAGKEKELRGVAEKLRGFAQVVEMVAPILTDHSGMQEES